MALVSVIPAELGRLRRFASQNAFCIDDEFVERYLSTTNWSAAQELLREYDSAMVKSLHQRIATLCLCSTHVGESCFSNLVISFLSHQVVAKAETVRNLPNGIRKYMELLQRTITACHDINGKDLLRIALAALGDKFACKAIGKRIVWPKRHFYLKKPGPPPGRYGDIVEKQQLTLLCLRRLKSRQAHRSLELIAVRSPEQWTRVMAATVLVFHQCKVGHDILLREAAKVEKPFEKYTILLGLVSAGDSNAVSNLGSEISTESNEIYLKAILRWIDAYGAESAANATSFKALSQNIAKRIVSK